MEGVAPGRSRGFSLRAKLALVSLVLLVLPWSGYRFVTEMERFLLEGQRDGLIATARAVATALHDRPQLLEAVPSRDDALRREAEEELRRLTGGAPRSGGTGVPLASESAFAAIAPQEEITAILRGVERSSSRIWVVNRRYQVLALAGSLRRAVREEEAGTLRAAWLAAIGWLIEPPNEQFAETLPDNVLATGRDILSALQGTPGTRTRRTPDGRARVVSAAYPIWAGNEIAGAVVVEETTNPIASLRSAALEQLLALTLAAFAAAAAVLIGYATRLSGRIRRLRDEAEVAIDARGHITPIASGSQSADEIGDLSRSFSSMLARLSEHHAYLDEMAGRLSHELRTPIAVVRSSLENMRLVHDLDEARPYIERAEEGLTRLNTILQRMSEASRLEQSLRSAEQERYDLVPVLRGCVEGYRIAYPRTPFALDVPGHGVMLDGSPDLAAQLLDKLVANAVEFSPEGETVRVLLTVRAGRALLEVHNRGPRLPEEMRGRLFQSMVSVRAGASGGAPHLGLGLYVARLIAEFHGGLIDATDTPAGDGVVISVSIPVAWR